MLIVNAAQDADPEDPGFVHAVALAARGGARLVSVHVREPGTDIAELPEARALLQRWGLPDTLVHERLQQTCTEGIDESLLAALARLSPDLLVASTHARTGLSRLAFGSVAEGVARNVRVPTLLLPLGGAGFVDSANGALQLARVLVPAATSAAAAEAIQSAVALARLAGIGGGELVWLHVGTGQPAPDLQAPRGFRIVREQARGAVDHAIIGAAHALAPDLVVMVTGGHDGIADVLLASHTERVLHGSLRPLLWLPAGGRGLS